MTGTGKIRDIRNFQIEGAQGNIPLPVPKLKNAFSAPEIGRWSSIGTQYLLRCK
jgi:hypothetical protein